MENVEKEIQMENEIRKQYNFESKMLKRVLTPLVGQKVTKVNEELLKKVAEQIQFGTKAQIEPLTEGGYASLQCVYLKVSNYSLCLYISINYNGGSYEDNSYYCKYKSSDYYIGQLKDQVLTELNINGEMPPLDAVEQRQQYDKIQALNKQLESEKGKLFYGLRDKKWL